jgi:outer membrane protein OmpA-like peptidoglycan-associated protein
MQKLKLLFLLVILVNTLSAQETIHHDTFDNDNNNWSLKEEDFSAYVKNGKLIIENNSETQTKWLLKKIVETPDEVDFDVEATITLLDTKNDKSSFGLVWSCYNNHKYYDVVNFNNEQKVQLYEMRFGGAVINKYVDWKELKEINKKKKSNIILVQKRANILKIFVNKTLVYQEQWNRYYGSKVGFILDANMKIAVDEFTVKEYPFSLDVVNSFNPNLKMKKLPITISTEEFEETNPVISADGKTLYFVRKDCELNIETNKDDIWYSEKDKNGNWKPAENIGRPLNNKDYNFVISVSPDNNTLLLGNKYSSDGVSPKGKGLSISNRTENGWEIPKDVEIQNFQNVNKYVGYFLANDNKYLIMSVERTDEGEGKTDLYVSFLNEEGVWSKPKNLGNTVNSFEDETNPFLASDGKTLYFASKGHPGYGDYDLFVSKRLDDTWQNWSKPKNLGNVINSDKTELSIFLSAKGDKAYIGKEMDIWEIDNTVKQDPVVLIKGKVFDSKTRKVLSAPIVYNNLLTNKELGTAISDPTTGAYSIVLPYGQRYSFMAQKEGYYAVTENVDVLSLTDYKEVVVDLYLNPIEKGQTIRLNNIFFDSGKYDLLPESNAELDRLYKVLKENQKLTIEITGHTDAVGSDVNNMTLSNNRANAVMQYLIAKGISKDRLTAKGYGETKFIATNETEEGKQLNRRVEFVIIEL